MIELLARFTDSGVFLGAHTRDANGCPTGLSEAQLPAAINTANLAAMARVTELEGELATAQAQLDAYKARGLQAAQAVLDAPDKATCDAIAADIRRDERARQRLAALDRLAEAQAEADKFDE